MTKHKKILLIIYSFLAVLGLQFYLRIGTEQEYSEFMYLFIWGIYAYFLNHQESKKDKRLYIVSGILSFILAILLVMGRTYDLSSDLGVIIFKIFPKSFLMGMFIFPIMSYLMNKINNLKISQINKPFKREKYLNLRIFIGLLIPSFIVYLAMYPGVFAYDASYQVMQFMYSDVLIGTHYSPLVSWLLYIITVKIGTLFSSYATGYGIYVILQILFIDFAVSYLITYIYQKFPNKYLTIILTIFMGFLPPNLLMQIASTQDTLWAGVMVLFLVNLMKIIFDKKDNISLYVIEGVLLLLLFLLRNNGIYIMVLFIPTILIFLNKNKKLLLTSIISICLYICYTIFLIPAFNICKEPSIREMSSVPSQQIARVVVYKPYLLTSNDIDKLNNFYPNYDFSTYIYRQSIADSIKIQIDEEYTKEHLLDYLKLYLKLGVKAPKEYIEAFILNTLSIWYPDKFYNDERMYHPYIELDMTDPLLYNKRFINVERDSKLPMIKDFIYKYIEDGNWQNHAGGGLFSAFNIGTYFFAFIFVIMNAIYKKEKLMIIPISFIMGYLITIFLAPVSLVRYCYSLILVSPLFIEMVWECSRRKEK